MLTKKQLKIFHIFTRNIFQEYSFKEIKIWSKDKSNSVLQNAIKKFLDENLISEKKIGTSKLYKINHDNDKVYDYLDISINETIPKIVKRSLYIVKNELDKYLFFYSLVIFGSYVNKSNKEKSDLDIAIFIPKKEKNIKIAMNSAQNKSLLDLDFHPITDKDFLEMLKVDYANLGKEIAKKNLPVCNSRIFYKLVLRGIKNGFKVIS